jgi:hypothetical protein
MSVNRNVTVPDGMSDVLATAKSPARIGLKRP